MIRTEAKKLLMLLKWVSLVALVLIVASCKQPTEDEEVAPPPPPNTLVIVVPPAASVAAGSEIPLVVEIRNHLGAPVTAGPDSTAAVTVGLVAGTGPLNGAVTIPASAGVANFTGSGLSLTSLGSKTLQVSKPANGASGALSATTSAFNIYNGGAANFVVTLQPAATVNAGNPVLVSYQLFDTWSNPITVGPDATANITLSLQAGTGILGGSLSKAMSGGVVSFAAPEGVNVDLVGLGKVIRATKADTSGSGGTGPLVVDANAFEVIDVAPPTSLVLKTPATSPGNITTPEITVSGVASGNTVKIFSDAGCTVEVGSAVASGASVDVTLAPALVEGSYTFHGNQEDGFSNVSTCSVANVVYDLDTTPPDPATTLILASGYAPNASTAPLFSWTGSGSPDVAAYQVALGTSSGGQEVVVYGSPDTGTTHTFGGLSLTECAAGAPVYWPTVKVIDTAGNESVATHASGFYLDTTAPVIPAVPTALTDASATQSATANWTAATECQMGTYQYAIGTSAGATDILNWKDVGDVTSYQAVDGVDGVSISLSNGVYYYTTLRATDGAGLVSAAVDSAGWRYVTAADAITDLASTVQTSTTQDLTWTAPNDNGAAITDYVIEYKETSSGTWIIFADGVSAVASATVTGLVASTSYDFRVKSFNGATSADSNIVTEETLPETPSGLVLKTPSSSPGNVTTPEITISGVTSGNTVKLFTDSGCTAQVGSAVAGGASVDITVGAPLSEGGYTFYANQEDGYTNSSLCSTASVSYDLDSSAPNPATVLNLASSYAPSSATAPLFSWTASTSPDVAAYKVALGTTGGGEEVVVFTDPDTGTTHTFGSLSLTECSAGAPVYWPTVKVIDTAGNETPATHVSGFRLDTTTPVMPSPPTAAGDVSATQSATASWAAATENCEVINYEYAIGTTPGGTDILNWKDIGNVTSYQAVDGVTIAINNGVYYYTSVRVTDGAGLTSTAVTSSGWRFVTAADAITDLAYAGRTKSSVALSWTAPNDNGAAITDYFIQYKETSSGTWLTFADGVSAANSANVTGLLASTSYDFRVQSYNGGNSAYSNVLTQETAPDDPFFDPTVFSAMNCGGATKSSVVALDDNTNVDLNGTPLAGSPINAGETLVFDSVVGDVITSDKPIFASGRLAVTAVDYQKGNIVWNSPDWAGKDFITVGSRDAEHVITVYAFENADITITEGATTHVNADSVTAGSFQTYRMPNNAGYKIASTGTITAYQYSEGTGNDRVSDNFPILPPSADIIGVPSRTGQYTTIAASTSYNWYESNNTTGGGTLTEGVFSSATGNGAQYSSPGARVIANDPIIGRSNADSDGYDSAPFIPKAFMKPRYAINHLAEWVSFVSDKPAVIQVFQPSGSHTTLTLTRTGNNALTPYFGRLTNVPLGTIFESNVAFAAYYESDEAAEISSSREDETVMFGADSIGLPVNHKLKLWLDADDSDTLFQVNDCTSIVASDGDNVGCWKDKSLQGNDVTQSGGNKPTWKQSVSALAGSPGVDFDGGTNYLNFSESLVEGTEYTIFAIVHRDTTASNNYFMGTQSAVANQGLHLGFNSDTSARLGQYSNDLSATVAGQAESSVGMFWGRLNSSGKKVFYNGVTSTDATATQISSAGSGVIGRGYDSNGFDGQIAELIVFDRALSDLEIDLMEEYLRDKWLRPTLLGNVRLWLDGSDQSKLFTNTGCTTQVAAAGNNVLCWKDKSGNGYAAKQSSGTTQWAADGGRKVVAFTSDSLVIDGTGSGAVFSDSTSLQKMEVFAVMKTTATGSDGYLFHHGAGNGISALVPNGSDQLQIHVDVSAQGSLAAAWGGNTSTYYRWNMISDSVAGYQGLYRDNSLLASDSDAPSVSIGTENFYIGAFSGSSSFQNMNLGSLLIFESRLSADERHMIRAYLDSKW